jgi:hypothetical protein
MRNAFLGSGGGSLGSVVVRDGQGQDPHLARAHSLSTRPSRLPSTATTPRACPAASCIPVFPCIADPSTQADTRFAASSDTTHSEHAQTSKRQDKPRFICCDQADPVCPW